MGMPVEGCSEEVYLLLSKLRKTARSRTPCKGMKKKLMSISCFERELRRLDCLVSYGDFVLTSKKGGRNYWELTLVG